MKKGRRMRITAAFFAAMVCFTVLSRAADQAGIAVVQTERPQNRMIEHTVRAAGRVVQNQELAVTTEPDQRVQAIYVNEGDRVAKGDLLFEVDMTLLQEKILYQQQEMEKQSLQVTDAKSRKEVSAQQKASAQAQASEQYSLATRQAGVQVKRAKEKLAQAKKALKKFRKASGTPEDSNGVEEALSLALQEKTDAYIAAVQELDTLKWRIENAVNTALNQARYGVSLTANQTVFTQAAGDDEAVSDGGGGYSGTETTAPDGTGDNVLSSDSSGAGSDMPSADLGSPSPDMDIILPGNETYSDTTSDGGGGYSGAETTAPDGTGDNMLSSDSSGAGSDMPSADLGRTSPDMDVILPGNETYSDTMSGDGGGLPSDMDMILSGDETYPDTIPDDGGGYSGTETTAPDGTGDNMLSSDSSGAGSDMPSVDLGSLSPDMDMILPGSETYSDTMSDGEGGYPGTEITAPGSGEAYPGSSPGGAGGYYTDLYGGSSGVPSAGFTQPTEQELERVEQSVRNSYSQELKKAQKKVKKAQEAQAAAEAALMQYRQERLKTSGSERAATEMQLIANLEAARQAYEDAAIAANAAAVTSGRAVQIAGIPDASDSSDRTNEITYEQMELSLQKLENLREAGGKVYAAADGLITKINIMTGEKTTDTTAILMADLAKGCRFTAEITKEQEQYIGAGDAVTLSGSGKERLEELPVESVAEDEAQEGVYRVSVRVPDGVFEIGASATLDFCRKSEQYTVTVPLSALHLDEKKQTYVLVPEVYESIMGTGSRARRVDVTVLEQNESYAALAEGVIDSRQEVIIGADRAVDDRSRIRVADGT